MRGFDQSLPSIVRSSWVTLSASATAMSPSGLFIAARIMPSRTSSSNGMTALGSCVAAGGSVGGAVAAFGASVAAGCVACAACGAEDAQANRLKDRRIAKTKLNTRFINGLLIRL